MDSDQDIMFSRTPMKLDVLPVRLYVGIAYLLVGLIFYVLAR